MKLIIFAVIFSFAYAGKYDRITNNPQLLLKSYLEFREVNHKHELLDSHRLRLYRSTLQFVEDQNRQKLGYESEINFFADMTPQEKERYLGFNGTNGNVMREREVSTGEIPKVKSWINEGAVTEVKNQGDCGSCWSFGSNGGLETAYKKATGVLRSFSEQELLDCVYGWDGCGGGWPKDCLRYSIRTGRLASTTQFPYKGETRKCNMDGVGTALIGAKVADYKFTEKSETAVVTALAIHGSLSVAFEVTSATFQYHRGIFRDTSCRSPYANHAVVAVGYTEKYVLVKNSWGKKWGDDGFIKFARNHYNCHLWDEAHYPIMEATDVVDNNPADKATDYVPNPDHDDDDYKPCFDSASNGCDPSICKFESFAKRFCQKTCKYCTDETDGECPGGTVRCPDGSCKHVHMC